MNQKLLLLLAGLSLFSVLSLEFQIAYAADPPDRPTNLQAIAVSPTRVDLFWNTPENNGGSPITGYKIQVRTGTGDFVNLNSNTGNTGTTFSHTGLTTGTTYIYHVAAINAQGVSVYSTEAQAKPTSSSQPLENIVPNTPTSLTASDISSTSIKLSWATPATNNGPPLVGYKIEFKKDSGSFTTLVENTGSTITTYTHSGLTTNSKYTYKISAINSVGTSSASNEASATPKNTSSPPTENIVPNQPRSFTAQPAGPTQIFLSWKEPSPNNGPAITGYKIEYKTTTGDYTVLTTIGNITSYTHTGLTKGTQYSYRVSAINSAGTSIVSNVATAKPNDTIIPTNLIADDISPTAILLTWTAPSQTYGGNIAGYIISKKFAADVYDQIGETTGQQTSYTVTGLQTGQEYTFVVKARYSIGTSSDYSSPTSATPTASSKPPSKFTVPNAPTGLTATASSPIQIDLVWNAPTNDGGSQIIGYKIDVKTGTGGYVTLKENTGTTIRSYTHTDRTTGTTYTYRVYAINSVGTGAPSNEASATPATSSTPTVTKTKPSQPTSLVATAISQNQINLSWKLPTNDGNATISGYKIEVSEGSGGIYQVLSQNTGKNTAYSHTGLKPGVSYSYRVYAINAVGTSPSYAQASTTTKAAEKEPEPEPTKRIPDFVDPKKGAQYYLDRYNNEPAYKKWFDTNYPDYTIKQAIELAIPDAFPEDSVKPILPFVDPKKDPQYYIDRYNNEPAYKKWFDTNYPDYTIFEAVGVKEPGVTEEPGKVKEPDIQVGICGPGTVLVNGNCEAAENKSGGGCLIATATFGSELSPQVQSLRELRDNTLLHTNFGSSFMTGFNQFYYLFSPTVADFERENPLFKEAVKITITPMLTSLSILNYANIDSEQDVLVYGLGVILLNIGMYFALPTFTILTVKRNLYHKLSKKTINKLNS